MRLSTFAAEPRPVRLGGDFHVASKIRVRDLAALERWMMTVIARPAPGEDDIPGGWPPTLDTEAGQSLISCGEGISQLVLVSLRQAAPDLTIDRAREIAGSIADGEFPAFFAAVFPEDDHEREPSPAPNRRSNWHARINAMAKDYGYTPAVILDMPLDQFFGLGSEPRADRPEDNWEVPIGRPEDLDRLWAEKVERQRARAAADADGQT